MNWTRQGCEVGSSPVDCCWALDASYNLIEFCLDLLLFPQSVLPLGLGDPELLLQLPDVALLVLLAVIEAGECRDEHLDLLLLQYQVPRQLELAGLELIGGDGLD